MTFTPRVFKMKKIALFLTTYIGGWNIIVLGMVFGSVINHSWIGAAITVVLLVVLVKILNDTHEDYSLVLTWEGLRFNKIEIKWEDIKMVEFTVDSGSRYRRTDCSLSPVKPKIKIETESRQFDIFTKNYIASKLLRDTLKEACGEKSIHYLVEDRGAY